MSVLSNSPAIVVQQKSCESVYWRGEAIATAVIVGFAVLFFWPTISGKTHLVAINDTSDLVVPSQIMFSSFLRQNIFALWNPYNFAGTSLSGSPQFGIFYPLNVLIWWTAGKFSLEAAPVYAFHVILHVVLFSIGLYWFARAMKLGRLASLVAAIGGAYAPGILIFVVWGNSLPSFSWWGFALASLVLANENDPQRHRYVVMAGIFVGLSILAAPSQPALQLILLVIGLFLAQTVSLGLCLRALLKLLGRYLIVGSIGISVGSISLFPVFEFAGESVRFLGASGAIPTNVKIPWEAFTEHSFGIENLSGFLFDAFSNGAVGSNFIGVFLTLGVALAVANYKETGGVFFWYLGTILLVSIFYAFNLGLPRLFYYIPGLNLIREPERYCQTFVFASACLAAHGVDGIGRTIRSHPRRAWTVAAIAGGIFILVLGLQLGFAAGKVTAEIVTPVLIASATVVAWLGLAVLLTLLPIQIAVRQLPMVLGLFSFGVAWQFYLIPYHQLPYSYYDPRKDFASISSMALLKPSTPEPFRVMFMEDLVPQERVFNRSAATVAAFHDIWGYGNPVLSRALRAYGLSYNRVTYLSLLNVRYVVSQPHFVPAVKKVIGDDAEVKIQLPNLLLHQPDWSKIEFGDMVATENKKRFGAAWVVNSYDVVDRLSSNAEEIVGSSDPESFMQRTEASDIDLHKKALVDRVPKLANGSALTVTLNETPATIVWNSYGPNGFEMVVNSSRDALLVVSELWYPGWRATVNGAETEIVRADWLLRAVAIPAGSSTVRFNYRPLSLLFGAIFTAFGLSLSVLIFFKFRGRAQS